MDIGSSYLPSEIIAAFLYAQLEEAETITQRRCAIYNYYSEQLAPLQDRRLIRLPQKRPECRHNAHMFFILVSTSLQDRDKLLAHLNSNKINAIFHYMPLHTSPMGLKMGHRMGELPVTEELSARLIRLPCYFELLREDQNRVIDEIYAFFGLSR